MESSLSTAAFALCSLPCEPDFTITLFSHFGGGQIYLPYPFRHACIYQALCVILCNLSLSSSALFSVILGLLALSVLKRNRTPPDFSKGSLEFINLFAWRHFWKRPVMYMKSKKKRMFSVICYIRTNIGISCFSLVTIKSIDLTRPCRSSVKLSVLAIR